jgi:hypothetical protein
MSELRRASSLNEFALREPEWWRDLTLGLLLGASLVWAFADAMRWSSFKSHITAELVFVGIPFALASLSPRRLLVFFLGLTLVLFRCIFLIFLFQNLWSALATIAWLLLLICLGYLVNRRYESDGMRLPEGFTIIEVLLLAVGVGGGLFLLSLLRRLLGLG